MKLLYSWPIDFHELVRSIVLACYFGNASRSFFDAARIYKRNVPVLIVFQKISFSPKTDPDILTIFYKTH